MLPWGAQVPSGQQTAPVPLQQLPLGPQAVLPGAQVCGLLCGQVAAVAAQLPSAQQTLLGAAQALPPPQQVALIGWQVPSQHTPSQLLPPQQGLPSAMQLPPQQKLPALQQVSPQCSWPTGQGGGLLVSVGGSVFCTQ